MHLSHLRILLLSSLPLLVFFSCSPVAGYKMTGTKKVDTSQVHPVINPSHALKYNTSVKIYNRHYSGLIVVKQTDPETAHLTFVTQVGMKMFDFEIKKDSFKLTYIFEPLNKPKLIRLLESDMKLILLQHLLNKDAETFQKAEKLIYRTRDSYRYYYQVKTADRSVQKIIKKGKLFQKIRVCYAYMGDRDPQNIYLKHKGLVRLKIKMDMTPSQMAQ